MSTHRMPSLTLLLTLAATACDVSEVPVETALNPRSAPSASEIEVTFCASNRQIAKLAAGVNQCPSLAGWTDAPLFGGALAGTELARFCRYDWSGAGAPDVSGLQGLGDLVEVDDDCAAVVTHTAEGTVYEVWDQVGDSLEYAFHYGIGRPTASDLGLSGSIDERSSVTVAVIDTFPESKPVDPRSRHGEFVTSVIDDIACPVEGTSEDCAVEVVPMLGLPRYIGPNGEMDLVDTTRGGYYGTFKDIAKAIYQAVESWEASGTDHLVINLSLGWDPETFGDANGPTPPLGVMAVYAAVTHARCHGALVIAAAGNQGYTCGDGPVAPASWELFSKPSPAACTAFGAPTPPSETGYYAPLVYSVGGLTHDLEEMPRSRIDGKPRLAALATNAVTKGAMTTVTGTSAAAAVASGAAALIWSHNPSLTPAQVMSLLYQNANTTMLGNADYAHASAQTTSIRAIDICAALDDACEAPGADCPNVASPLGCLTMTPPATKQALLSQIAVTVPAEDTVVTTVSGPSIPCGSTCEPGAQAFMDDGLGASVCPEPSSISRPYTLPQPTQLGCPNCTLDLTTDEAYVSIAGEFDGWTTPDVTISVVDREDGTTTYFRLGEQAFSKEDLTRIELPSSMMPESVRSASITITFVEPEAGSKVVTTVDPMLLNFG